MKLPKYPLKSEKSLMVYEFISEGKKGKIEKIIKYSETNIEGVYNLAFGDKDPTTGEIDDTNISNNGDSEKVLSTVVSTVYAFSEKYPNAFIFVTGSTPTRTRLYRMGLTKYFDEISPDFQLFGLRNGAWEEFNKGIEYEAFLAQKK
jgi:hypothetical protein